MTMLLIGCGYWGKNWAHTLSRMNELGAICEPEPFLHNELKALYPDIRIYRELGDALAHDGIEGCIVATPVTTHYSVASTCMANGKHVLVEKPLALDPTEAAALVQQANSAGHVLAVGHLLLYQPALLKLKSLIREGELGDILSIQCTRTNLGKIRNEENAWWSLAPHDLSILLMLLDEPLELLEAVQMTPLRRESIADSVYATFQTPSGKNASIHVSWLSPAKRHETVVIGTRKIAIFEDTQPPERKLTLMGYTLERSASGFGKVHQEPSCNIPYIISDDDLLTLEAKRFLSVVRGQSEGLTNSGENGLQVVHLLDEVQMRIDSRQKTVPMLTV